VNQANDMTPWTPTREDREYRARHRHLTRVLLMVEEAVCEACGQAGFLRVRSTVGRVHRVRCGCDWTGKLIEPE